MHYLYICYMIIILCTLYMQCFMRINSLSLSLPFHVRKQKVSIFRVFDPFNFDLCEIVVTFTIIFCILVMLNTFVKILIVSSLINKLYMTLRYIVVYTDRTPVKEHVTYVYNLDCVV